jgi:hypothetical protein
MTDAHYPTYREMLEQVDWNRYGVVEGVARDPRCENCMTHCGYDPSGALGTNYQRGDHWKNFRYNFWPRPAPAAQGRHVDAFNGCSTGKGHLAEARAALKTADPDHPGGGGTTRAEEIRRPAELQARIASAKKISLQAD